MIRLKEFLKQFPFIYPSRIISSCGKWIDKENLKRGVYAGTRRHSYELIKRSENHTHQLPVLAAKSDTERFSSNIFYQTSPAHLFYLRDCYVYKQTGLVLTNGNALFQEFTHHFNIESLPRFILKNPFYTYSNHIKRLNGIGAILVSPQSHNYYHWLFDVLPRIKLYNSVLGHIDHFCISSAVPRKFIDILPEFGIPKNKIRLINNKEKLHFDNLYVASLPGSEGRSPRWGIDYVREILIKNPSPVAPTKKIYLKRGLCTERRILNEHQLIESLKNKGFDIIELDNLTIQQQISLMRQAALVISVHGAALSNLLFVQEGTAVIEIFSPDYFRTDCYFTLARLLNLNYHYLQGAKPASANWGDIDIDETAIMNTIKKITGE